MSTFGDLLRRYRVLAGLSQEALAERARLSAAAIASLERGRRTTPRPETVMLLAAALDLEPGERMLLIDAAGGVGLETGTAPPAAHAPRPTERPVLPAPPTALIAREREEATVAQLLQPGSTDRLVTLTGPGGVGKTRLALAVAAFLRNAYPDGVAFVDLSALRDSTLVASTIAQGLGLREEGAMSARDLLLGYLRDRALLLVLDNLEQVVESATLIGDVLAHCPRVAVLATSRVALRVRAERRYIVPPLAVPEAAAAPVEELRLFGAVQLFEERARMVQPSFSLHPANAEAVVEICRRLDGVPLAVELAAARVPLLPPDALLARLGQRLPMLKGGARDLPARQQTLRATIEWSYALLSGPEQALLRRLSVFAGGCTLQAAEAVVEAAGDTVDVWTGVETLLDHSLLQEVAAEPALEAGGAVRVRMLETIREYAQEQLAASGEEERSRQAHAAYHMSLAEVANAHVFGPQQLAWLERLEREGDNLRAALARARDRADVDAGARLVGALWRFWYIRCWLGEGRSWLEAVVAMQGFDNAAPPARVEALIGLAVIAYAQTDYPRAALAAQGAVDAANGLSEQPDLLVPLNILGGVARYRGRLADAARIGDECVAQARASGDRWGLALSLHNLADAARLSGAYEHAAALAAESLALSQNLGDQWGVAQAMLSIGRIARDRGDAEAAEMRFQESLDIARPLGHTRDIALALVGLAGVALLREDSARALSLLEEALSLLRPLGDRLREAEALAMLGRVLRASGDAAGALQAHAESLRLAGDAGALVSIAENLEGIGVLLGTERMSDPGQLERAVRLLAAAAVLRLRAGAPRPAPDAARYERDVEAIRATIGDEALATTWHAGATAPSAEVVGEALRAVQRI